MEYLFADSKPPDENPLTPKDPIRPAEINNMNSDLESMSNGRGDLAEGTHEPPSDVSSDIPTAEFANNDASKPRSEGTMKSMERMVSESTEFGRGKRRAKKVVRQKRWKKG